MPKVKNEEEIEGIVFQEYEDIELNSPSYLIVGFPDAGLVGGISISHIIREMGPMEVGGIDIPRLTPPVVFVKDGEAKPPMKLFKKENILMIASEIPIPATTIQVFSYALLEYAMRRRVDFVIGITGLGSGERVNKEKPSVFAAYSGEKIKKVLGEKSIPLFSEGAILGPFAIFLKEARRFRLDSTVLLAEAFPELPDPEAASVAIEALSKIIDVNIGVQKLLEEAEYIRLRNRELMKQTARLMAQAGRGAEAQPSLLYT
ncbi:MAG: proteasome assembly chaperone family protein [Thermoprotei archaeon]|nr:proteasome assembly chaperone family protein [Thermoprotei archaeon]